MMMMMRMMKVVVVLVLAGVPVVQAQATDPCDGLNQKKCGKKEECTFSKFFNECYLIVGIDSVIRDGSGNAASGELCTTGGGQYNTAGGKDDTYNVVGGGQSNQCFGDKNTIAGGRANTNAAASFNTISGNTISGGFSNNIYQPSSFTNTGKEASFSVITGGGKNFIEGADITISGGKNNQVTAGGSGDTVTGGFGNLIAYSNPAQDCVITGGSANSAVKQGSVVAGGSLNLASGTNSLALGQNAAAIWDHSMVVNLIEGSSLTSTEEGEFLVNAESFYFQIGNGNGNGNGGIDSTTITKTNIQNLRTALEEEE